MQERKTGNCPHGTFYLDEGCPQCIAERRAREAKAALHIVKVRYGADPSQGREYSYYSEDALEVGDVVNVPTKNGLLTARVSTVNVPPEEVAAFKDAMRTIPAGARIKHEFTPQEKPAVPPELEELEEGLNQEGLTLTSSASSEPEEEAVEADNFLPDFEPPEGVVIGRALPVNTALINIAPDKDGKVIALYNEACKLLEYAQGREIKGLDDLKLANNDLTIIANLKKSIEEVRKGYTGPIRAHLEEVNDAFKRFTEPLKQADDLNRQKVAAYNNEQARRQREQEEINRKRLEAAEQEMKLNQELSEPVNVIPVQEAPKRVSTASGTTGMVDNWKYRITDFAALPDDYKVADTSLLNSIAKKHHDQKPIPGVEFYNEPTVRVTSR